MAGNETAFSVYKALKKTEHCESWTIYKDQYKSTKSKKTYTGPEFLEQISELYNGTDIATFARSVLTNALGNYWKADRDRGDRKQFAKKKQPDTREETPAQRKKATRMKMGSAKKKSAIKAKPAIKDNAAAPAAAAPAKDKKKKSTIGFKRAAPVALTNTPTIGPTQAELELLARRVAELEAAMVNAGGEVSPVGTRLGNVQLQNGYVKGNFVMLRDGTFAAVAGGAVVKQPGIGFSQSAVEVEYPLHIFDREHQKFSASAKPVSDRAIMCSAVLGTQKDLSDLGLFAPAYRVLRVPAGCVAAADPVPCDLATSRFLLILSIQAAAKSGWKESSDDPGHAERVLQNTASMRMTLGEVNSLKFDFAHAGIEGKETSTASTKGRKITVYAFKDGEGAGEDQHIHAIREIGGASARQIVEYGMHGCDDMERLDKCFGGPSWRTGRPFKELATHVVVLSSCTVKFVTVNGRMVDVKLTLTWFRMSSAADLRAEMLAVGQALRLQAVAALGAAK